MADGRAGIQAPADSLMSYVSLASIPVFAVLFIGLAIVVSRRVRKAENVRSEYELSEDDYRAAMWRQFRAYASTKVGVAHLMALGITFALMISIPFRVLAYNL